ncbi:putative transport protein [Citrobacter amalonaticus]|nr:putative transport protein [Citrobacter amalonaticus]
MAKPIITLNGLKIVIMLGMLVIILTGIRFAADIIVPFILALFIAVVLSPLVQRMVKLRVPRVLAISLLVIIIVMAMVLLLAYLGTSLNELARTLPQYRSSLVIPLKNLEPWLVRLGIGVSVDEMVKYIDPQRGDDPDHQFAGAINQCHVIDIFTPADSGLYAAGSAATPH